MPSGNRLIGESFVRSVKNVGFIACESMNIGYHDNCGGEMCHSPDGSDEAFVQWNQIESGSNRGRQGLLQGGLQPTLARGGATMPS